MSIEVNIHNPASRRWCYQKGSLKKDQGSFPGCDPSGLPKQAAAGIKAWPFVSHLLIPFILLRVSHVPPLTLSRLRQSSWSLACFGYGV